MALQRMIDKCSDFAKDNGLIFNVDKSVVIVFVKSRFVSVVDPQLVNNGGYVALEVSCHSSGCGTG